jgi:Na+-translocating ferredoxin:NAD+ oxidoreductase RnfC subunit
MSGILEKIQEAGVVGAGGAGFPTHVKFARACEYILLNGAECEPMLEVDQQIASVHTKKLFGAMSALVELTGAKGGVFALKEKYHDAIRSVKEALPGFPKLCHHELSNAYPAGDEHVLVYEVFKRIVPEGGIPLDVGVVVLNVETLYNIAEALEDRPVTEKYLTVAGEVKNPATLRVPVGVSFGEVIASCGGATVKEWVAVDGGPMMGRLVTDPEEPVTKTTKGILLFPPDHPLVIAKGRNMAEMMRLAKIACCHCMLCTDVCPRYLLGHQLRPDKLMRLAAYNSTCEHDAAATEAFLCCECGLCETACIMGLQPWKLNKELKVRMNATGIKNPHHEKQVKVNPFREYRLFPVGKLTHRLGLAKYVGRKAPLKEEFSSEVTKVVLKLKQHIGAPATPVVSEGERVERGQIVARGEGPVSAHVHSSIEGVVGPVEKDRIVVEAARWREGE